MSNTKKKAPKRSTVKKLPQDMGQHANVYIAAAANRHTQRARRTDLMVFVEKTARPRQSPASFLSTFLEMEQDKAALLITSYQNSMKHDGRTPTTINRRLATLRGLIRFARDWGATTIQTKRIVNKPPAYSSPRLHLTEQQRRALCNAPPSDTVQGLRDRALLTLLCTVPLHGGQISLLTVADFNPLQMTLRLPIEPPTAAVNKAATKEPAVEAASTPTALITLDMCTCDAIGEYLKRARRKGAKDAPLFRSLHPRSRHQGKALTSNSVLEIVRKYGEEIGQQKLNPRSLRHAAIARALNQCRGDTERAMRQFPHIRQGTWETYRYEPYQEKPYQEKLFGEEAFDP